MRRLGAGWTWTDVAMTTVVVYVVAAAAFAIVSAGPHWPTVVAVWDRLVGLVT